MADQLARDVPRIHPDKDLLRCQPPCGYVTTRLEASRRRFNTNRCPKCNGPLLVYVEWTDD